MRKYPRLGLELRGVIADSRLPGGGDDLTSWQNYQRTLPMPGAIEAVSWLGSVWCFHKHLAIFCELDSEYRAIAREWLNTVKFFQRTGLKPHQLHFVDSLAAKVQLATELQLTHFVASEIHTVAILHQIDHRFCMDAHGYEYQAWQAIRFTHIGPHLKQVANWGELLPLLTCTI